MKKISAVILILTLFINCCFTASAQEGEVTAVSNNADISVNAKAYILMDSATGTVLTGKNENEKLYPASVTKIMTLLLVCEALDEGKLTLDMKITCSDTAANKGGSQIWLEPGEVMTVNDLLKATVVYSANDACCLLGETISGNEASFCSLMNERAKELGMNNTNFDNCTGLDDNTDNHKTTAYDIALMSRELIKHDIINNYTTIWMDTLRGGITQLVNTNKLIRTYPGATGLKTGTTSKAGCCVSATAQRDGLHLIAVVLGADNSKDRFAGAENLLDWGFANYEMYYPEVEGCYETKADVIHGVKAEVQLTHGKADAILIKKGTAPDIVTEINIDTELNAPVTKNQIVGEILFRQNNKTIGKCEILAAENIEEMTFYNALKALLAVFRE